MDLVKYFIFCIILSTILHESEYLPVDAKNGRSLSRRYDKYYEHLSGPATQQDRIKRELYGSDCHRYIYDVKKYNHCPPRGTETRKSEKCYNCRAPYTYHCRKNKHNKYVQGCAIPKVCFNGTEATLNEGPTNEVSCDVCKHGYFNDKLNHSSNSLVKCEKAAFCVYEHIVCVIATPSSNTRCTCNYKEGYKPSNISLDCPEEGKPDCVKKICVDGETLDGPPDYECNPENGERERTTDSPQKNLTEVTSKEVPTSKPAESTTNPSSTERSSVNPTPSNGESNSNNTGAIVGSIIGVVLVGGALSFWLIRNRTKRRPPEVEETPMLDTGISSNGPSVTTNSEGPPEASSNNGQSANNGGQPSNGAQGSNDDSASINDRRQSTRGQVDESFESATEDECEPVDEREVRINCNKELLTPDICLDTLHAVQDRIESDLITDDYIVNYRVKYAGTMRKDESKFIDETEDMRKNSTDVYRNREILKNTRKNGVECYSRFKYCLPDHLLSLVETKENKFLKSRRRVENEPESASEVSDEHQASGPLLEQENGNTE